MSRRLGKRSGKLRKLQAARLKEARKLRGFKTAAAAARRYNWHAATYVSHENGTRGIGRAYPEYAKKFRVRAAWILGHSHEREDQKPRGLREIIAEIGKHNPLAVETALAVLTDHLGGDIGSRNGP
jgi:hypothetical protein